MSKETKGVMRQAYKYYNKETISKLAKYDLLTLNTLMASVGCVLSGFVMVSVTDNKMTLMTIEEFSNL